MKTLLKSVRVSPLFYSWCLAEVRWLLLKGFCLANLPLCWSFYRKRRLFWGHFFFAWGFQHPGFFSTKSGFMRQKENSRDLPPCLSSILKSRLDNLLSCFHLLKASYTWFKYNVWSFYLCLAEGRRKNTSISSCLGSRSPTVPCEVGFLITFPRSPHL